MAATTVKWPDLGFDLVTAPILIDYHPRELREPSTILDTVDQWAVVVCEPVRCRRTGPRKRF
jgi:hypothetical protein